jgi:hypothetical protein
MSQVHRVTATWRSLAITLLAVPLCIGFGAFIGVSIAPDAPQDAQAVEAARAYAEASRTWVATGAVTGALLLPVLSVLMGIYVKVQRHRSWAEFRSDLIAALALSLVFGSIIGGMAGHQLMLTPPDQRAWYVFDAAVFLAIVLAAHALLGKVWTDPLENVGNNSPNLLLGLAWKLIPWVPAYIYFYLRGYPFFT